VKPKVVDQLAQFVKESRKFAVLLNYAAAIREATNLGALWFRETSLDIEQKMQYPVRSSLPFILAEHILRSEDRPALNDSVFFPFEIYNDAAALALNLFKSQFLYREVEAELSLCIEMISISFSHVFYKTGKEAAARALSAERTAAAHPVRYGLMVRQNSLQLLGAAVDFNIAVTRQINAAAQLEIEKCVLAITDLRALPFCAYVFRVLRRTHTLLTRNGLRLDEFDAIWRRAVGATDPLSPGSAIARAALAAVDPGRWVFSSLLRRFTSPKEFVLPQPSNDAWVTAYAKGREADTRSIGADHIRALVEILNPAELAVVLKEIFEGIDRELGSALAMFRVVADSLWLVQGKAQDEAGAYFRLMCDGYAETRHTGTGRLFNALRVAGNLTALAYAIESEVVGPGETVALSATVAELYLAAVRANSDLFEVRAFDCEQFATHRTFPALWCLLEFQLCCPNPVVLSEQLS
jgi:cytoplasmic FMR1 interacting protein